MTKEAYEEAEGICAEIEELDSVKYDLSQCSAFERLGLESQTSIFEHIDTLIDELQTKFNEL